VVIKDEKPIVASQVQVQAVAAIDNSRSSSSLSEPKAQPKPTKPARAPISWLRQAAEEIQSKNGNPNPERTRHSNHRHRQAARPQFRSTSGTSSLRAMAENPSGKLQQKDYTPEVDKLLPQATALAQVGVPRYTSSPRCPVSDRYCMVPLGRGTPGGAGEALYSREASKKRASLPIPMRSPMQCAYISVCVL